MLKLTVKQLFESFQVFTQFAAQKFNPGNQRLAYNLGRTLRDLKKEAEMVSEQQQEIFRKYPHKESQQLNGSTVVNAEFADFTPEQKRDFDADTKSLDSTVIEVWGHSLTIEEIEKANLSLSPNDFALLDWLIADEEIAAPKKTKKANG